MQLAAIEFARNVAGLKSATTSENDPDAEHQVVHSIPFDPRYQKIKGEGASMRLGGYDCVLKPGSFVDKIYADAKAYKDNVPHLVSERHRHRFEFNNIYREPLEKAGLVISGTSPDDMFVEMIELPKNMHPFFVATQAHPEYKSRPLQPHCLFVAFLKAASKHKTN
jgi:CTP synthase